MDLGHIEIHTVSAQIDIRTQSAAVDLRQPLPHFTRKIVRGAISVEHTPPQLDIDSSGAQSMEGHKTNAELSADAAEKGMQAVQDYVRQQNEDGRRLLRDAPKDKHVVAEMAREKTMDGGKFTPTYTPWQSPQISFTDNDFNMEVTPDEQTIDWEVYPKAEVSLSREADLKIGLSRYPEIDIEYIPPARRLDVKA